MLAIGHGFAFDLEPIFADLPWGYNIGNLWNVLQKILIVFFQILNFSKLVLVDLNYKFFIK